MRQSTTQGLTEFRAGITSTSTPFWTAAGPDGNVWFTESVGNRVGRITVPGGVVTEFATTSGMTLRRSVRAGEQSQGP